PLNAQTQPTIPDQQITGYRGPAFFGPWTGTAPAPGRFHSGGMLGGLPSMAPQSPTLVSPAPAQQGPIELGLPQPAEPTPVDDLGTELGAPRTYREEGVPAYSDPQAAPEEGGETIRRRQDGTLDAPAPADPTTTPQTYDPATQALELKVN